MNLNSNILAKRNLKGLAVQYYHRFLNNSITITTEDRGTNNNGVPVSIATGCAWNSVLIDGIDMICSLSTIGREIHFNIDIHLSDLYKITQNDTQTILKYLKLTESSRHFLFSILKILTENRQTDHVECMNNTRNLVVLKSGDIVMVRTAVQSNHS